VFITGLPANPEIRELQVGAAPEALIAI